ncbi:MAG: CTP synthase, partial [Bacilli bacterium]|nr:CTP synthase [Bacilli bacterium]
KVYWNVLNKERRGEYLGKTVQVIPHITNEIKDFIYSAAQHDHPDVLICEIGGTVGDIESQPFLEAVRQIGLEVGKGNALFIHVTLIPYLECSKEHKSKPTQHSVKTLQGLGINPDILVLRCSHRLEKDIFGKLALFCNIKEDCIIENRTLPILYEAPLMLERQHLGDIVCRELGIQTKKADLRDWRELVEKIKHLHKEVTIALVGKYVKLHDAYLSVAEALSHAGYHLDAKVKIKWIDSETIDSHNAKKKLEGVDGVIVPGGFGDRGIEGMVATAQYCRENDVPYLGICLGMQVAVIEYARNVCHMEKANSREFDPESPYKVIDFLPDQNEGRDKGGTLRLGHYDCLLKEGTTIQKQYQETLVSERHRHRYEFSNAFRQRLEEGGLIIGGTSPDGYIVETVETHNDYFVGVQFHPEFKSRPNHPHPLFLGLVGHALKKKEG